jgi:hypothetical protein
MHTIRLAASLALALGLTACVDASDHVSDTDQAATVYNDCATSSDTNAMEYSINAGDTYTRSGHTINQTCSCMAWQVKKNATDEATANAAFPNCRPTTIVDFGLGAGNRILTAQVDTWNVSSQTECQNSTFSVALQQFDWTTDKYVTIASSDTSPTWNASTSTCSGPSFAQEVAVGVGGSDDFRIRAKATRGLDQFNHGFEGVIITSQPD